MSKYLFEISWEIGNKVGGIYTVISSKAKYIKNFLERNYFVIGPYLKNKDQNEFRFMSLPREFQAISESLNKKGIKIFFGEWLVEGLPHGFLIDFEKFLGEINSIKYELWEKFGVDSLRSGEDYDQPIAWSKSVSEFIKELKKTANFSNSIIHCHEWLSGAIILFLKDFDLKTVFTTHATVLGRTLSAAEINFWNEDLDPLKAAYNFGVEAKHLIEKKSAETCTYFTTVSNITSKEAEKFLGRKADFILPNGIDLSKFGTFEEISRTHGKNKKIIFDFILNFFSPYYKNSCPITNSLIFFTSGRKEIRNKGFDILIYALGKLNKILKDTKSKRNIFVFIFVPDEIIDVNHQVLENITLYRGLKEYLEDLQEEIISRIFHALIHQRKIDPEKILTEKEIVEAQRIIKKVKTEGEIPFSMYLLSPQNEFLQLCQKANLKNQEDDNVKIIIYPIYLSSVDNFLNLDYYSAVNGCHLGIFPSLYEPWGYTPLEALANGVISITSDSTGFADYVEEKKLRNKEFPGLFILKRKNRNDKESIEELTEIFLTITNMERSERIQNKYEARRLASCFDWQELVKNYLNLYEKIFSS